MNAKVGCELRSSDSTAGAFNSNHANLSERGYNPAGASNTTVVTTGTAARTIGADEDLPSM